MPANIFSRVRKTFGRAPAWPAPTGARPKVFRISGSNHAGCAMRTLRCFIVELRYFTIELETELLIRVDGSARRAKLADPPASRRESNPVPATARARRHRTG